jgi:hypothetical protein
VRAVGILLLRPGLRVFRRDDEHLQVGIDEPRLVLADSPGVRHLLTHLERGTAYGSLTPDAGLALARLVECGLVVEQADVSATRSGRRAAVTAVFAAYGPDATPRLAARSACRVLIDAIEPWHSTIADWVRGAGLLLADAHGGRATVTMVVSLGEPARSRSDELARADQAHLLVTVLPDRVRVGPFVVPGVTACLRCVDAHLGEQDPRRALVLEQLEDSDPGPAPCDPLLAHAGLALAVRDLTSYADGDRPATWSTTLTLTADLSLPRRSWKRHPHCGCSWG